MCVWMYSVAWCPAPLLPHVREPPRPQVKEVQSNAKIQAQAFPAIERTDAAVAGLGRRLEEAELRAKEVEKRLAQVLRWISVQRTAEFVAVVQCVRGDSKHNENFVIRI